MGYGRQEGIIALACIPGVCVNLVRKSGIPLAGDCSTDSRFTDDSGRSLVIGLKDASLKYAENKAVFLYASYDKILHPQAFAEAVYNYQILPDAAVNAAALGLP